MLRIHKHRQRDSQSSTPTPRSVRKYTRMPEQHKREKIRAETMEDGDGPNHGDHSDNKVGHQQWNGASRKPQKSTHIEVRQQLNLCSRVVRVVQPFPVRPCKASCKSIELKCLRGCYVNECDTFERQENKEPILDKECESLNCYEL
jgi:hypothetical protein